MRKSTAVLKVLLALPFAGVLITSASAQRGYSRDYSRGSRGSQYYSRGYQNNYKSYNNYSYHAPFITKRAYSPIYYGPRYYGVPRGSVSITFGGSPYYYYGGSFYRPYGGYYHSIFPPIGIRIGMLPMGYIPISAGPDPYYFYNGTYYRRYDDRSYEVVDAPMGAQLSSLPEGAKSVTVNGEKFYELNGSYYKEDRDSKGRRVYTVVGKNGEINNTDEEPAPAPAPRVGDKIAELPANSKMISLNGERLYVTPDDIYYRKEADGSYTIVGVSNETT